MSVIRASIDIILQCVRNLGLHNFNSWFEFSGIDSIYIMTVAVKEQLTDTLYIGLTADNFKRLLHKYAMPEEYS